MGEIYPDEKYFIRTEKKGKKKISVYAIRNPEERGVIVQTIIESLESEGEQQISEKYYPDEVVLIHKINNEIKYSLTGGL